MTQTPFSSFQANAASYLPSMGSFSSGGVQTRLDSPWPRASGPSRSYQELDAGNFASLRDRARNLEAVNWLACGMLDRAVENVIGTTFRVESRTRSRKLNRRINRRWKRWAGTTACDVRGLYTFGGILRMAYRAVLRDGDVGIVLVAVPYFDPVSGRLKRRPKLQIIEGERICDPWGVVDGFLPNGNACVAGVEMDGSGRPVAYHVKWTDKAGMDRWERIEARDMVFLRRGTRYSNVRGETVFRGEGFRLFDQISGVIDAVVVAWRVGASQAMIAKKRNPAGGPQQGFTVVNTGSTGQTEQQRHTPIQSGTINHMNTDEDLVAFNPSQPQQQFPQSLDAFARILGTKFGLTLERVLLNFGQTVYSSGKMAQNQEKATAAIEQEDLAAMAVSRIREWWVSIEVDNGDIEVPEGVEDWWAHEWIPPYKPSPEPLKDYQAKKLAIELGIEARSNAAMEDGYDFEELCERNEADQELMKKHKLATGAGGKQQVTVGEDGQLTVTGGEDGEASPLDDLVQMANAYGVMVRSGAITPQTADEDFFRRQLKGLPVKGADVAGAWKKDGGVRRPITLVPPGGKSASPFSQTGVGDGEEDESANDEKDAD